ncbi:RHS repeat-associated core domain-containing protein, partial [Dokdonella sp.]|uniref:RHS repeat domain-containing protein n=1 Tax=Dokdonella sp. TaxID=2291710 RepID=UPI0027B97056
MTAKRTGPKQGAIIRIVVAALALLVTATAGLPFAHAGVDLVRFDVGDTSRPPPSSDFGDEYQSLPLQDAPTVPVALGGVMEPDSSLPSVSQAVEYGRLIRGQHATGPLDNGLFGESVDYYTGETDFVTTDVSLPGSSALPVAVGRRFQIRNRSGGLPRGMFGDWDIDLPHVEGIVATGVGWTVPAAQHDARCTNFGAPPPALVTSQGPAGAITTQVPATEYNTGFAAVIPGMGRRELLLRELGTPAPGGAHPVVTRDLWAVKCIERNGVPVPGQPDEGFVITTPDGVVYTFTQGFVRDYAPLERPADTATPGIKAVVERQEVWLLPTKVEDRFGNKVVFSYQYGSAGGIELRSIEANDGRRLAFTWISGLIRSVSDGTRTWNYQYDGFGRLKTVTLPDGGKWSIGFESLGAAAWTYASPTCQTLPSPSLTQPVSGTIEHPAGGKAKFTFEVKRHGRAGAPATCLSNSVNVAFAREEPAVYDVLSLTRKDISGVGIEGTYTWKLEYDGCSPSACSPEKTTTLTDARNYKTLFTFGAQYGTNGSGNEGMLLRKQTGGSGMSYLQEEQYAYFSASGQPYPAVVGTPAQVRGDLPRLASLRPVQSRTLKVDGATYSRTASNPDQYGFPRTLTRIGTHTKTETLTYAHNLTDWVLGTVRMVESGAKTELDLTLDSHNQPKEVRAFGQLQNKLDYYTDGLLRSVTDANNHRTDYSNYKMGIPRTIQYADASKETATVSDLGLIRSRTDELSRTTLYDYDSMGRLQKITPPGDYDATTILWSHDSNGYSRKRTTGSAIVRDYYDAYLRAIKSEDSANRRIDRTFDADGRITFESYPNGLVNGYWRGVTSDYDALGRLQQQKDGEARATIYTRLPNELQVKNRNGHVTAYQYKTYDEPSTSWPTSIKTPTTWTLVTRDAWGKPELVKRGTIQRTLHYYDNQRLREIIEPETGVTAFTYYANGDLKTITHQGGTVETRLYDARDRLQDVTWSDATPASHFTWRDDGQPDSATLGGVSRKYAYNGAGLLVGETLTVDGAAYALGYDYDAGQHLKTLKYPGNTQVALAPDAFGRPTQVGSFATGVDYHADDAIHTFTYGNGITHTMTQTNRRLPWTVIEPGVTNATYSFDYAANPTGRSDTLGPSLAFTYDNGERLKTAAGPWGTSTFTYDDQDNLRADTVPSASLTVDAANRIDKLDAAPVQWDARGRLRSRPGGLQTTFDGANRLTKATFGTEEWTYAYDALGHRALAHGPGVTITTIHDHAGRLLYETRRDEPVTDRIFAHGFEAPEAAAEALRYLYLGNHLIARERTIGATTQVRYQHTDALGTPIAQSNESRQVTARSTWYAYGSVYQMTQPDIGPGYAGRYVDPTGLIYMQQRYYDPRLHRFISPDPVWPDADTATNFNRYAYANNSPYRYIDPDGRAPCETDCKERLKAADE